MPLDVVADLFGIYRPGEEMKFVFYKLYNFVISGDYRYLFGALSIANVCENFPDMLLEVAKHFEEGCKKYGENNWQKGIPVRCYVDSAIRHYLKHLRGDNDERHDRAFCWNVLCCIWTCKHKPELNDYRKEEENDQ
jgi:hypothetical protein